MEKSKFYQFPSWSVDYNAFAYDDARNVEGIWCYLDLLSGKILRFPFQQRVVPLFENAPKSPREESWAL